MELTLGRAVGTAIFLLSLVACAPAQPQPSAPAAAKPTEATAPKPAPAKEDAAAAQQGQQLIAQKGCGGCHVVPGVAGATGNVGPSLAGVASRTTIAGGALPNNGPADLQRWIMDPPAAKPGTQMPNLGLSQQEAQQIVAYLETLR